MQKIVLLLPFRILVHFTVFAAAPASVLCKLVLAFVFSNNGRNQASLNIVRKRIHRRFPELGEYLPPTSRKMLEH